MLNESVAVSRFDDLELGLEKRRHRRHRVFFAVRLSGSGAVAYAENLSLGGLFLRDVSAEIDDHLELELSLPGNPEPLPATARVAHRRTRNQADSWGGTAGVGLELVDPSPRLVVALQHALRRIALRRDVVVFCDDADRRDVLSDAGYHVAPLPEPGRVAATAAAARAPLYAVVASAAECARFGAAEDVGDDLIELGSDAGVDETLAAVDQRLGTLPLQSWR